MATKLDFNKLPWYGQVGVFLALAIAGVVAFYFLYVSPAKVTMAAQERRLETLRGDINKGLATARKLPDFRADVQSLQARLEGLRTVLPEEKEVADLLRRIQALAVQSNIRVLNIKPSAAVPQKLYAEIPHTIDVEGTYHNLGLFLDRVSKMPRIMNVSALNIKGKERPEPNSTITASFMATTYILQEPPPEPAPGRAGAAGRGAAGRPAAKPPAKPAAAPRAD